MKAKTEQKSKKENWWEGILGFFVGFLICWIGCNTGGLVKEVEVIKKVPVEVEVVKEVPVEVIKEVEVTKNSYEKTVGVYKEGTYKVGVDIPAGEYVCEVNERTSWNLISVKIGSNPNFDNYSEYSIELYNNRGIFRVKDGDYVQVSNGFFYLAD